MDHIVDETFVINMDKEINRLYAFNSMMTSTYDSNISWKYVRMPAINGKDIRNGINTAYRILDNKDLDNLNYTLDIPSNDDMKILSTKYVKESNWLSPGEYGCLLSHVLLWEKVANDPNLNRIAIFEDDARTHIDVGTIKTLISDLYKYLENNNIEEPDMLYLGKALDDCMNYKQVWKNVYWSTHPLCLHSYIISKNGARKLLQKAPYNAAIDMIPIYEISNKTIKVMSFHPSLYFQDVINNISSLRNLGSALNITTECLVDMQHVNDNDMRFFIGVLIALISAFILYIAYTWNI